MKSKKSEHDLSIPVRCKDCGHATDFIENSCFCKAYGRRLCACGRYGRRCERFKAKVK